MCFRASLPETFEKLATIFRIGAFVKQHFPMGFVIVCNMIIIPTKLL